MAASWRREIWPRNDLMVMNLGRMVDALGMIALNLQIDVKKIENIGGRGRTPDLLHARLENPSCLPLGHLVFC